MNKKQVMTAALVIGGLYLLSRMQHQGGAGLPYGAMNPQGFPGSSGLPFGAMNPQGFPGGQFQPVNYIRNFLPGNAGTPTYGTADTAATA